MTFYQNLAKSEISTLIGTKKPRFNIEWESTFRSDRFRGLEKQTVMVGLHLWLSTRSHFFPSAPVYLKVVFFVLDAMKFMTSINIVPSHLSGLAKSPSLG